MIMRRSDIERASLTVATFEAAADRLAHLHDGVMGDGDLQEALRDSIAAQRTSMLLIADLLDDQADAEAKKV